MKRHKIILTTGFAVAALFLPALSQAQGVAQSISGMQPVLDNMYNEMLPLCDRLIDVARGIAGFGALWYIASRTWRQIASAEPIDFYPMLRPFTLGLAIILYSALVIPVMNGILQPTVTATSAMVQNSDLAIATLLKAKENAVKKSAAYQMYIGENGNGDSNKWYKYTHPHDPDRQDESTVDGIGNDIKFWMDKQSYNFRNSIKEWLSEVLQVVFAAASLCINTIRTFYLLILAILGPLVFGFAVFDGLQQSLSQWIARYINVFLWLPVANIFGTIIGKIQEKMLAIDISQIGHSGDTFFSSTDTGYLIFLIIGIVGYRTVPSVAGHIIHAGGANTLLQRVTSIASNTASSAGNHGKAGAAAVGGRMASGAQNILQAPFDMANGYSGAGKGSDYQKDKLAGK
jgi:conjugative transposon TraJ protein